MRKIDQYPFCIFYPVLAKSKWSGNFDNNLFLFYKRYLFDIFALSVIL